MRGTLDMLRLEREPVGLLAAARAETGVDPRREGDLFKPLEAVLGERACPRVVEPLAEGGSAVDDLLEFPAVPGLRGVADIVQVPRGPRTRRMRRGGKNIYGGKR